LSKIAPQGPPNPDVFQMPNDDEVPVLLEEIVKESKLVQDEILFMLNQVKIFYFTWLHYSAFGFPLFKL
jgi:hypothetical protein